MPYKCQSTNGLFLKRVLLKNFKSIASCCVTLRPLSFLVGRNGAGKSNFLDALRFVVDGLETTLDHAIKSRGGLNSVRRISTGHPRNFAIALDVLLPDAKRAIYEFEIAAGAKGAFVVKHEKATICDDQHQAIARFAVREGKLSSDNPLALPPAVKDRLYLVTASSLDQFRPLYDALKSMGFYNLNPEVMKELQSPDAGELLHRDGGNIASVVGRLAQDEPKVLERIQEYLSKIVPDISSVARETLGPKETLEFRQRVKGADNPWKFYASSMSDGTLRALGTLIAVKQLSDRDHPVSLVGIEEPETALHPAAAGALMEALREASVRTQVIITSHSPDMLERVDPDSEALFAVQSQFGETSIAPPEKSATESIRNHLYDAGELLRMDQLTPDSLSLESQPKQLQFEFGEVDE